MGQGFQRMPGGDQQLLSCLYGAEMAHAAKDLESRPWDPCLRGRCLGGWAEPVHFSGQEQRRAFDLRQPLGQVKTAQCARDAGIAGRIIREKLPPE